jgi:hypothetical protein
MPVELLSALILPRTSREMILNSGGGGRITQACGLRPPGRCCATLFAASRLVEPPRFSPSPAKPGGCNQILVEGGGFEPPKAEPSDLQSDPFGHSGTPPESPAFSDKEDRLSTLFSKEISPTPRVKHPPGKSGKLQHRAVTPTLKSGAAI